MSKLDVHALIQLMAICKPLHTKSVLFDGKRMHQSVESLQQQQKFFVSYLTLIVLTPISHESSPRIRMHDVDNVNTKEFNLVFH